MKKIVTILVFIIITTGSAHTQWQKVLDVKDSWITAINFLDTEGPPKFGFIGLFNSAQGDPTIYRTTDYGSSWQNVTPKKFSFVVNITSFGIKDSSIAWFTTSRGTSPYDSLYKTTDGGLSWYSVRISEVITEIEYVPKTQILFASGYYGLYRSFDEGVTWDTVYVTDGITQGFSGITFINDSVGILNAIGTNALRTTDGGLTWNPINLEGTGHGMFAEKNGNIILKSEEYINPGGCWISTDTGLTWTKFFPSSTFTYCVGAQIAGNLCHLYAQGQYWVNESVDTGKTWRSMRNNGNVVMLGSLISGRIYAKDSYLFVCQNPEPLYGDSVGTIIPGEVWRYIGPIDTPRIFIDNPVLEVPLCSSADTLIQFIASNRCDGDKAVLDTIYTTGSANFTITHNALKREIVWDTLGVTYTPTGNTEDTAFVHFRFKLKGNYFDTVMTIRGKGSNTRDSLSFSARFVEEGVTAGGVTNLVIEPSKQVSGKGLTELVLSVTYNGDILECVAETTAIPNANIIATGESVTGGITTTTFRITGTDLSLDPTQSAATIRFRTYLSDTTITPITLTTKLNPQDPSYERCTLSAATSDTTFALTLLCGDTSISGFLKYGKLQLSTIRPNPTSKDITVDFYTPTKGATGLQVIDELGRVIVEEKLEAKAGTNTRTISLPSTWSGTYYLRLQMGNDVVTGKFVKQ